MEDSINMENVSDEELLELDNDLTKERALSDLYFLNREILKHNPEHGCYMNKEVHGEFCSLIENWKDKMSLFLLPRGTYKTSIITEGYVIQKLLRDRNETVLIYCETYTRALKYVRAIREHFEDDVKEVFGNVKDPTYWREEGFRLKGRTIKGKEPSVTPGGIDKPGTGDHYSLIIVDDIHGETNTTNPDQIEKANNRLEELFSVLKPGGRIVIIGTIWDEQDVYCRIIKKEGVKTSKDWDKLILNKILIGKTWNIYLRQAKIGDMHVFPEVLGKEALDLIEGSQSSSKHKMQYYNDPRKLTDVVFTEEMRDRAKALWADAPKDNDGKPKTIERYIFCDPAESQTARADFTGLVVMGIDEKDNWFFLEAIQVKLDTEEIQDSLITLRNQYKPLIVSVESKGFQKILIQWLRKKIRAMGLYFRINEYEPGNKLSKAKRIETLLPRFKAGTIGYSENMVVLDQQLRRYPNFTSREHDDVLDAAAQATTVIQRRLRKEPAKEDTLPEIKQLFISRGRK